jgi:tetratricopeptide (TPR) repeat protein
MGELYREKKDYMKAMKYYVEAKELGEKKLNGDHRYMCAIDYNLGRLYDEMNQFEMAYRSVLRAVEVGEERLGVQHVDVLEYKKTLMEIEVRNRMTTIENEIVK